MGAGTVWENSIKVGPGKLKLSLPFRQWFDRALADLHLSILPLTVEYADRQATLPPHHRDSFDRLLVAQPLTDSIPVVSSDRSFDSYGAVRVW